MSTEVIVSVASTLGAAIGAGLMKWGPDFFRWMTELVKGRTAVTLRVLDETAKGREETQRTFEQLGTWKERARWMQNELKKRDEHIEKLEGELKQEREARKQLEARVKHLEGLVLDMIGPPAPPASVTELKGHRR